MKPRNPIAGNAHRYNVAKPFTPKKGPGSYQRTKKDHQEINPDDPEFISE